MGLCNREIQHDCKGTPKESEVLREGEKRIWDHKVKS